jgi:hypothetical protein
LVSARVVIATLIATAAAAACTAPVLPPPGGGGGDGGGGSTTAPTIAGCPVFPADNAWNQDVSGLPVSARSANYVASINASGTTLHPDFGGDGVRHPVPVVPGTEPPRINYTAYGDERPQAVDPADRWWKGAATNGDRHVVVVQRDSCHLYELGRAFWKGDHWDATVGVSPDLVQARRPLSGRPPTPRDSRSCRTHSLRRGRVAWSRALRFTVSRLLSGSSCPQRTTPPRTPTRTCRRWLRLRLRPSTSRTSPANRGDPRGTEAIRDDRRRQRLVMVHHQRDPRWNDDDLNQLKTVPGAFETVDTGPVHLAPGTMRSRWNMSAAQRAQRLASERTPVRPDHLAATNQRHK